MIRLNQKSFRQAYLRVMQHHGSPESTGRGVAIGLFVAFFIPFSLQVIIAFPLAILLRAARFPAVLFTLISNPFSIPFIYPLQCFVGSHLIRRPLSYEGIRHLLDLFFSDLSIKGALDLGTEIILSFLAGGLLFGGIAAAIGYITTVKLVQSYRRERKQRLINRINWLHKKQK